MQKAWIGVSSDWSRGNGSIRREFSRKKGGDSHKKGMVILVYNLALKVKNIYIVKLIQMLFIGFKDKVLVNHKRQL